VLRTRGIPELICCSLGAVDPATVVAVVKGVSEKEKRRQALLATCPPLDEIVNLHDFEVGFKLLRLGRCKAHMTFRPSAGGRESCPSGKGLGLLFLCVR